jgi:hypothetical protein
MTVTTDPDDSKTQALKDCMQAAYGTPGGKTKETPERMRALLAQIEARRCGRG